MFVCIGFSLFMVHIVLTGAVVALIGGSAVTLTVRFICGLYAAIKGNCFGFSKRLFIF